MRCSDVRFVKELYPRLKPVDSVIERYRYAIDQLPPIVVARGAVLVDGYHRWQAHVREELEDIAVEDLGDLSDAEIIRESIRRNATHGQQLSNADKERLAAQLWFSFGAQRQAERVKEIADLLAVTEKTVRNWTKDARKAEHDAEVNTAADLWLDCLSQREIAKKLGIDHTTVAAWLVEKGNVSDFHQPPESRQHFDVWQFATADDDAGAKSYFGAVPSQVIENLLWYFTEPDDIIVDLFAGSGTTIDVSKAMGRRVWASDIRGNHYSPHLPIHAHDVVTGWPADAPAKASFVFLDPPYWKQAEGRYSDLPNELAQFEKLDDFYSAWREIVKTCMAHTERIGYIISPTQMEDGTVVDHATDMLAPFENEGWRVERRIIVPYNTQQATGQQVTWARENKRMLKLYRDLVVMTP